MHRHLIILLLSFLGFACSVEAATAPPASAAVKSTPTPASSQAPAKSVPAPVSPVLTKVNLYDSPAANGKVLAQLESSQRFIPIFHQGDWVKVGLAANGQVGWINYPQYQQARESAARSQMEVVYVHAQPQGKDYNIVAYKNGEKLNDADANALYQKVIEDQRERNQRFLAMQRHMDRMFARHMEDFDNFFMDMPFPMMRPIIVVESNKDKDNKK